MKITIISDDGLVSKDGVAYSGLNFNIDPTIHAIQWYDTFGEVEYRVVYADGTVSKPQNRMVNDSTEFQSALDAWSRAYDAHLERDRVAELAKADPQPVVE